MTIVVWKPNGEKFPHTNVVTGMELWLRTEMTGRKIIAGPTRTGIGSTKTKAAPRHEAVAPPRGLTDALGGLG